MKNTHFTLSLLLGFSILVQPAQAGLLDSIFGKSGDPNCKNIFQRIAQARKSVPEQAAATPSRERLVTERAPRYLNDLEYLEENKLANGLYGVVDTRFMKEWDTRVYYTATAKPRPDGTIPMVDPDAKALVIYFHGSGTIKASGAGFSGKMNSLSKLGYSGLSIDLPHHMDGSRNPTLEEAKAMADYIHKIVESVRVPGQKVILTGHSFGPEVVSEYITRYPHSVDNAVLLSPAGMDEVARKWNDEVTSKMDFGEMVPNDAGGSWAYKMSESAIWNKPGAKGRVDPTVANPKLKIEVVTGDREEYFPGELGPDGKPTTKPRDYDVAAAYKPIFKNVEVTVEPGIGHLLFAHQDAQGRDVVLKALLKANGEDVLNEKEIKKEVSKRMTETRTAVDTVAIRYSKEIFFRDWLDMEARKQGISGQDLIVKMIKEDDKKGAQKLANTFLTVEKQRVEAINNNIKNTANWAPAFYNENKALIDQLGTKGFDPLQVHTRYLNFLKTQSEETITKNSVADTNIFVIPEKPQPTGPRPDRPEGERRQKPQKQQMADGDSVKQQGDGEKSRPARQPGDDSSSKRQQGDSSNKSKQQGDDSGSNRQQGDEPSSRQQQQSFYKHVLKQTNLYASTDWR